MMAAWISKWEKAAWQPPIRFENSADRVADTLTVSCEFTIGGGPREQIKVEYLVATVPSATRALLTAVHKLGGKQLINTCGIVPWEGSADSLALKLHDELHSGVVVSRLEDDWSYR